MNCINGNISKSAWVPLPFSPFINSIAAKGPLIIALKKGILKGKVDAKACNKIVV